jgi:hypothetical protein
VQHDRLANQADVAVSIFGTVLRVPDLGILEPTFCVVIWVRSAKIGGP